MLPAVSQSVVLGMVGGLLAAGAITAISVASVIIMVVMIRKQTRIPFKKGCLYGTEQMYI